MSTSGVEVLVGKVRRILCPNHMMHFDELLQVKLSLGWGTIDA